MKQINNGYAEQYYLLEDGTIYNAKTDQIIQPSDEHTFILRTADNHRKKVSLKPLYKLVFNKNYCKDDIKDLDNEEWKIIEDTDGFYLISNKGRCKSLKGYYSRLLKPFNNKSGYARVDIVENGKRETRLVHRLVAAAFLPYPKSLKMQLHHKDFNKDNNAADNLEWLAAADHYKIHNKEKANVCTKSEEDNNRENQ